MENEITITLSRDDVTLLEELVCASPYALNPMLNKFIEKLYDQVPPFYYKTGSSPYNILTQKGWLQGLPNGKYENKPITEDELENSIWSYLL